MVDFNNPLAGKTVMYNINILRKVTDINEKVNALIDFLFRKEFKFEIKDKTLILQAEPNMAKFIGLFKDKFKDMLDLDLEVKEVKDKPSKTPQ